MSHKNVVSLRLYYTKLDYNTLTNHEKERLVRLFKIVLNCKNGGVVLNPVKYIKDQVKAL